MPRWNRASTPRRLLTCCHNCMAKFGRHGTKLSATPSPISPGLSTGQLVLADEKSARSSTHQSMPGIRKCLANPGNRHRPTGIAQCSHGCDNASTMRSIVLNGRILLRLRILGRTARIARGQVSCCSYSENQLLKEFLVRYPSWRMVALRRLPSLMYSSTARILSEYEYMNYLLAVQVFVRTPFAG
jgi:hypothetical protein